MRHSYFDHYSDIDSFLARLEPRIKILSFMVLILFILAAKPTAFLALSLYGLFIAVLIVASKIPREFILKRMRTFLPFILLVSCPVVFVGQKGIGCFWGFLIKAHLSLLCMILLTSSTRYSDLLKAFEKLRLPRTMVMILSFMYRYVFVLEDELHKMGHAKEARTVNLAPMVVRTKTLANMLGVLFVRAYERSEVIYFAMCARGFKGQIRTSHDFVITAKDLFFISTTFALGIAIRWMS